MTSPRYTPAIFSFILSVFTASPSPAAEGWFVGLSGGEAQFDGIKYPVTASVAFTGFGAQPVLGAPLGNAAGLAIFGNNGDLLRDIAIPTVSIDDDDTIWKISAGYQLNKYLAIEAGYFDAGEAKIGVKTVQRFTEDPILGISVLPEIITHQSIKYKVKGLDISALGSYPITEKFSAIARFGGIYSKTKFSGRVNTEFGDGPIFFGLLPENLSSHDSHSKFKLVTGLGIQYQISDAYSARLEWTRYLDAVDRGSKETDIDSYSLGVYYHFN